MAQSQDGQSAQSAVTRAESMLDRAGLRIGHLTGLATQRIQNVPTSLRATFTKLRSEKGLPSMSHDGADQHTTEKAEVLFDRMGQRMNRLTALGSLSVLKATAYIREGAEDMWAEAQSIRHKSGENSQ